MKVVCRCWLKPHLWKGSMCHVSRGTWNIIWLHSYVVSSHLLAMIPWVATVLNPTEICAQFQSTITVDQWLKVSKGWYTKLPEIDELTFVPLSDIIIRAIRAMFIFNGYPTFPCSCYVTLQLFNCHKVTLSAIPHKTCDNAQFLLCLQTYGAVQCCQLNVAQMELSFIYTCPGCKIKNL